MKFNCLVEKLKSTIAASSRITPGNATLPSLNGVLLKVEANGLTCIATNLETTLKINIVGKTEDEGSVCVPARLFNEVCQVLTKEQVSLESEGSILLIRTENFQTKLNLLPVEDFPTIPDPEKAVSFKMNAGLARQCLERVMFAASPSDTQAEIASVLLRSAQDGFVTVATDRYRLAKFLVLGEQVKPWEDVLIPLRVAAEAAKLLSLAQGDVEIGVGDQQIWWSLEDAKLIGRVIDGQYPAFEQILLNEYPVTILVDKFAFLQAIKASGVFVRNKGYVKLTYKPNEVVVTGENGENGESRSVIEADVNGGEGSVNFGFKYLLDGVNSVVENRLVMQLDAEASPVCLSGLNNLNYRYVVMPIRE